MARTSSKPLPRNARSRLPAILPETAPGGASGVTPVRGFKNAYGVLGLGSFGHGYHLADWSASRGLVYFPQLDTRREVTPYTRVEGLRKARYLDANVGLARRILNGMGRFVAGTGLMPNPTTKSGPWNKLMRARIEAIYGSAETYDIAGKFNGYNSQAAKVTAVLRDGDFGEALVRNTGNLPRIAFYEGHQIAEDSFGSAPYSDGIFDGVRTDRHGRRISFFIRDPSTPGQLPDLSNSYEIAAQNFIHLARFERFGATRGLTILHHAINNLLDVSELKEFLKHGIKIANKVGYALTRSPQAPAGRITHTNPMATRVLTDADGNTRKVKVEEVYSQTGGEIPELPEGIDIKMLLDQRPHPNTLEFFEHLIRDIALGCDWPPELLWNIAKLGGANTRYVMADAQSVIEKEQQWLVDTCLAREYVWFVANELASGRVPPCPDPEWWAHEFIPPARLTVDFGRDGALYLEQIRSGALTFRRYFGWQGHESHAQLDAWLDEYAYVKAGAEARNLNSAAVLANVYGRPAMPAAVAPNFDPADPTADPSADPNAPTDPNSDQPADPNAGN